MSIGNTDPDIYLNGEPASDTELRALENVAELVAQQTPGEVHAQVGHIDEETGAIVVFRTVEFESGDGPRKNTFVDVAQYEFHAIKFSVGFDEQGHFNALWFHGDRLDDLHTSLKITQDFIDNDEVSEETKQVLRFVQNTLFYLLDVQLEGHVPDEFSAASEVTSFIEPQLVDRIIAESGTPKLRVVERAEVLADGSVINVLYHEFIDGLPDEEIAIPKIQVELKTATDNYCYIVGFDGSRTMEVMSQEEYQHVVDTMEEPVTDEDKAVLEFRQQIGATTPGRHDVRRLTTVLEQIVLKES